MVAMRKGVCGGMAAPLYEIGGHVLAENAGGSGFKAAPELFEPTLEILGALATLLESPQSSVHKSYMRLA